MVFSGTTRMSAIFSRGTDSTAGSITAAVIVLRKPRLCTVEFPRVKVTHRGGEGRSAGLAAVTEQPVRPSTDRPSTPVIEFSHPHRHLNVETCGRLSMARRAVMRSITRHFATRRDLQSDFVT